MPTQITHVQPLSIADRIGMAAGDYLLSIGGEPVIDQIDYQALTASESFEMEIQKKNGQLVTLHVNKNEWEPLGITLDQSIVSKPMNCKNHCVFCFIDQMPPNMRDTLYVKDDDWRLSLMMGNYITMTNISEKELDRIIRRKVSPLFVSVHATSPELRVKMLRNPSAGNIMENLRRLKDAGIRFHCQMVLCPGWNDGEQLMNSIRDLETLLPAVQSIALVPVGLTKYRDKLPHITPYTKESAAKLICDIKPVQEYFLKKAGTRLVFPSDEFYCLSGIPLPEDEEYEDYPQSENGVGMIRLFESDLMFARDDMPVSKTKPRNLIIACGTSIAPFFQQWCDTYAPENTTVRVVPIINNFFGTSVTVTGLITGQDLIEQVNAAILQEPSKVDRVLICRSMIRNEGDLFLDDLSLEYVKQHISATVQVVDNTGEGFWRAIAGLEE